MKRYKISFFDKSFKTKEISADNVIVKEGFATFTINHEIVALFPISKIFFLVQDNDKFNS